jgi:hypothetical protein
VQSTLQGKLCTTHPSALLVTVNAGISVLALSNFC